MPSKRYSIMLFPLFLGLIAGLPRASLAADLSILFTTPQERQIINSNRYKDDQARPLNKTAVETEEPIELPQRQLAQEEVTRQYRISGITVSREGTHSVWINSVVYEDGAQLEDNSRIKVLVGDEIRVRITAPDGKHYYATSGETLEVSYLVTIQN
jgi:hypothetical protein